MRHSKQFLEKKFDSLYLQATVTMDKYKPCQISAGKCLSMREYPENHINEPFCCTGCVHLKKDGCSVKSLHCKLWTCTPIDNLNKSRRHGKTRVSPMIKALRRIRAEAFKYHFMIWRGTKAESVEKALAAQ